MSHHFLPKCTNTSKFVFSPDSIRKKNLFWFKNEKECCKSRCATFKCPRGKIIILSSSFGETVLWVGTYEKGEETRLIYYRNNLLWFSFPPLYMTKTRIFCYVSSAFACSRTTRGKKEKTLQKDPWNTINQTMKERKKYFFVPYFF